MNKNIDEVTMDCGGAEDLIDYIVSRAHPNTVALEFARLDEGRRQSLAIEVETFRTQLRTKTEDELRGIYRREKLREEREQREMDETDRMLLEETFEFNRPECAANFALWAKKAHWTLEEAAALLIGRSPEVVKWETVRPYVRRSIVAGEFAEIFDRATRAGDCAQLVPPISPGAFLAWAKNEGFDVPADLENCVRERGKAISDWQSTLSHLETQLAETSAELSEKKKIADQLSVENEQLKGERDALQRKLSEDFSNEKERTSVYKLMVGAAYVCWKFNPHERDQEGLLKDIIKDLEGVAGIKIDKGTARKWMKNAADHIDFFPPSSRSGGEN